MTCWCEHCARPFQPEKPRNYCSERCKWREEKFARRLPPEPAEPAIDSVVAALLSRPWRGLSINGG